MYREMDIASVGKSYVYTTLRSHVPLDDKLGRPDKVYQSRVQVDPHGGTRRKYRGEDIKGKPKSKSERQTC